MADLNLKFARNGAELTADLFQQLATGGVKNNIIFSPFSVQICVALAFAGAHGETAEEIAKGVRLVSTSQPEVAATFKYVLDKYKTSPLLKIANKVYVAEGHTLKNDYENTLKKNYDAEAATINFVASQAAANEINDWVKSKTANKITELVSADSLHSNTRLVLLNALHFKGDWMQKFDATRTAEGDFFNNNDETVKVNYMHKKAKFNYGWFEELNCTALEMPYKDTDLSMLALLPNERNGLRQLAEKLKGVNLAELTERMSNEEVVVQFPKFKVDYSIELSETLKKLGIHKMFCDDAEFDNMLKGIEKVFVSKVFHKAAIEVNEEGSEAAAATGMIMMVRCMMTPTEFKADHPFLYMIWDKRNILFAGAFVNAS